MGVKIGETETLGLRPNDVIGCGFERERANCCSDLGRCLVGGVGRVEIKAGRGTWGYEVESAA